MAKETTKKQTKRPTAQKRILQNIKKARINKSFKTHAKTTIRSFEEALANNDTAALPEKLKAVHSVMDKGVKRNIFKLNKASRIKSKSTAKVAAATK